jgi:hypothetical protein
VITSKILDANVTTGKIADANVTRAKLATGAVTPVKLGGGETLEGFTVTGVFFHGSGANGVTTGATGDVNFFGTKHSDFQWHVKGTQTLLAFPWVNGSGLNIELDQTANDGLEITQGIATTSAVAKTVGTDNFYFRCKVSIADVSGTDFFFVGLRKAQAYDAAVATYTDYAAIAISVAENPAKIKIITNLNNAGAATVDTTQTMADGNYLDVKIYQGDEARLQTAIDLAVDYTAKYNAHCADGVEHTAGADAVNTIAHAAPTTVATLITFVTEAMADYVLHDADAKLAVPLFHQAQYGGSNLASVVAPTTLAECVTRLNDLKTKYQAHDVGATAHDAGTQHQVVAEDACNTYFQVGINGALADPTVSAAFNFDSTDVIVPFLYFLQDTDIMGATYLQNWEVTNVTTT